MDKKKNNILAFGNKDFNDSLNELKNHFKFNLEIKNDVIDSKSLLNYDGLIIHEDILENVKIRNIVKDIENVIIFYKNKSIKILQDKEKIKLPSTFDQINNIVLNNLKRSEFKNNSSVKIQDYILDKNLRKLVRGNLFLELTEKEIKLIELLKKETFVKKKQILTSIWKYSDDADTHTVETHIYRLRKKIKELFNDENLIKSEKEGYTI